MEWFEAVGCFTNTLMSNVNMPLVVHYIHTQGAISLVYSGLLHPCTPRAIIVLINTLMDATSKYPRGDVNTPLVVCLCT